MATGFEKWIAIGKEMGLLDGELRQFVVQQQAEDRDRQACSGKGGRKTEN